jgi:hypothetical protein
VVSIKKGLAISRKPFLLTKFMVGGGGFEPPTPAV